MGYAESQMKMPRGQDCAILVHHVSLKTLALKIALTARVGKMTQKKSIVEYLL